MLPITTSIMTSRTGDVLRIWTSKIRRSCKDSLMPILHCISWDCCHCNTSAGSGILALAWEFVMIQEQCNFVPLGKSVLRQVINNCAAIKIYVRLTNLAMVQS